MKKLCLMACMTFIIMTTGTAMADSIKGRVGVTGRIGFDIPSDGVYSSYFTLNDYSTNAGLIYGGGFLYGFDQNWTGELAVTNTQFDVNILGITHSANIINISLGAQYRFIPQEKFVPYIGFGLDILVNDLEGYDVDPSLAAHVSGGVDYFLLKNLALNAEAKVVSGPNADFNSKVFGQRVGEFSTTSFSTTFGVRYFFN